MKNITLEKAQVDNLKARGESYTHNFPNRHQRRLLQFSKDHIKANNRKTTIKRGKDKILSRMVLRQLVGDKALFINRLKYLQN